MFDRVVQENPHRTEEPYNGNIGFSPSAIAGIVLGLTFLIAVNAAAVRDDPRLATPAFTVDIPPKTLG